MKRLLLLSTVLFSGLLSAQVWNPANGPTYIAVATFNTAQAAASYTVLTAGTQAVYIDSCTFYSGVVTAGLVSMTMQTDDTTPITMLASTVLAALTGGKNLTVYMGPLYLPAGKHIQATIVGTGTGSGTVIVTCKYTPVVSGGTLS